MQRYSLTKQYLRGCGYAVNSWHIRLRTFVRNVSPSLYCCSVAPNSAPLGLGCTSGTPPDVPYGNHFCESQCLSFTLLTAWGHKHIPHHANVCTFSTLCLPGSYIFVRLRRVTFKFGNFTNFKALFQVVSTDFPSLVHVKSWKNRRRFLYIWYTCRLHAWSSIQEKITRV